MEEAERLRELAALRQDRELLGISFELVVTTRDGLEKRLIINPSLVRYNHVTGDYSIVEPSPVMVRAGHKTGKSQMIRELTEEHRDRTLAHWNTEEMAAEGGKSG